MQYIQYYILCRDCTTVSLLFSEIVTFSFQFVSVCLYKLKLSIL